LLGALATWPWVAIELALERQPPVAWISAACIATLAGGGIGLLTYALRSPVLLTLVLVLTPLLAFAHTLSWLLRRAVELRLPLVLASELLASAALASAAAGLVAVLLRGRPLRRALSVCAALAVFCLVLPLTRHFVAWLGVAVPVCFGAAALHALCRTRHWVFAAGGAALAIAALHRIDPMYVELRTMVALTAIGLSVLASRRAASGRFERAARAPLALLAAALLLVAVAVGGELLIRSTPLALRARMHATGLSGALAQTLRALGDLDRDGYAVALGQRDCAPFDPAISPGMHEVPGNGIDDNCTQGDPGHGAADFVRGSERWHPPPPRWRGDVVLVVVDTLRYDDAQARDLAVLRAIETRGLAYDRAYASSSFTVQSLAGLLSGRMPSAYHYKWTTSNDAHTTDVSVTLLTELARAGYDVGLAGGVRAPQERGIFGAHGYGRGARVRSLGLMRSSADETTAAALDVWRQLDAARPRLLYVHYMALHENHADHAVYRERLRELDASLAALWRAAPDALWVVTADHGESFGLHGRQGHSTALYAEVTQVPLLVSWPGGPRGRIGTVTSLRSLPSTLIAMTAPERAPPGDGPYLCLQPGRCRDMVALMALEKPTLHLHGAVIGRHHVLHDLSLDHVWAYDLARDPLELRPIAAPAALEQRLRGWEERIMHGDASVHWPYDSAPAPRAEATMPARRRTP
jgi:hypothetical protein